MSNAPSGTKVAELRFGALDATLWSNPGEYGERLSCTLRRSFERNGGWQHVSMSIPLTLLLEAAALLGEMQREGRIYQNDQRDEQRRAIEEADAATSENRPTSGTTSTDAPC